MTRNDILPDDGLVGCLVGRIWLDGPHVCVLRDDGVYDLSALAITMSDLIDLPDPAAAVKADLFD
jgi:fumarylacetoacetate (FAA) hydrolase family protein